MIVHYGGVQALKGITIEALEGSVTSLIGANGAGKSTTLRAVSGLVPITSGEIRFDGKRIDGLTTERIVELGIVHVPEGKRLFLEMSVQDNLLSGFYLRTDTEAMAKELERIYTYFPVLKEARNRPASNLSGGEQQMVAICRGLMAKPKLLLLDEPSLGLSPIMTKEVGSIIKRIADEGVSILLIEQNANLALSLSSKCYVMETGTIAVEGTSAQLQNNDHVKAAYLGITADESPLKRKPADTLPAKKDPEIKHDPDLLETKISKKDIFESDILPKEPVIRWDKDIELRNRRSRNPENTIRWPVQNKNADSGTTDQHSLQYPDKTKQGCLGRPIQDGRRLRRDPDPFSFDKDPEDRWSSEKVARPRVVKKSYVPKVQGS